MHNFKITVRNNMDTQINTNFNQVLNFSNISTVSDDNGILQKTFNTFRSIKGRIEQVTPYQIFDGVQDEIGLGTTLMTTRYFPEVNSADIVSVNVRTWPQKTVVTQLYKIIKITTIGNEARYMNITAMMVEPDSDVYKAFETSTSTSGASDA